MSDDNPHSSNGSANKTWLEKIGQIFTAEPQTKEELQDVFTEAASRDLIDTEAQNMIAGVLDIAEMRVRDIMVPRSQMVTLESSDPIEELLPQIIDSQHSRFPVITEDKDHVEGILLAKDLLKYGFKAECDFNLADILRPTVIVPESKRVDSMLKEFRTKHTHMAIVVDEFGGVSGLVTIEDILELIVGEIEDETDAENEDIDDIRKVGERVYSVTALTEIDDFNEYFKTEFSDEDADTVGGLVVHSFGHLPERGESTELNGYSFKVINADSRRILQLQVTVPKTPKVETENVSEE
ncbi:CNNM family magnesium/cobalt transport protein CorC [Catenovulum sp. SM1970]|uniref:CNNM family magnesium/cobalt transport protein CorC n=1 Tax=Marinifaba aquimaris TaxID=2741323 RepID=UPI001573C12D|nr:CNNM family magnesium/cobalt transport protein CorC [Marinifaba aquimaris]NTS78404.1 CNNM family magnesium/cobalt transport protein CorC [Marinifaba aquimaris]